MCKFKIIGSGISGLSASYHLKHLNPSLIEKNDYYGGHIFSENKNGFIWDEGPHFSFTNNDYVKSLFRKSVNNNYLEYTVETVNYYSGKWIPHPAQSNLFAVPEPLRTQCLNDLLESRNSTEGLNPENYDEWLRMAFGDVFTDKFSRKYTRKYWTTDPKNLATDWVGKRVFYPNIDDVKKGFYGPLDRQTHYIKKVRYPENGGYISFANELVKNANISFNKELAKVDLVKKELFFTDGSSQHYNKLINTIPLTEFVKKSNLGNEIKQAADRLNCSSVLLVNVIANHRTVRKENWIYVYDEDKYSTRINCTELLSPNNAIEGKTGIQVEVYFSKFKTKNESNDYIAKKVIGELVEMGLIKDEMLVDSYFTKWIPFANVIFDINYKNNLDIVLSGLEKYGLERELDDLEPTTNWDSKFKQNQKFGDLILAGRYAQWKYFWTDDCVLRGKLIKERMK